jgi:hypothetical protein
MLQVEQDLLEEFLRNVLALGYVADEDRVSGGLLRQGHQGPEGILGLLGNHA